MQKNLKRENRNKKSISRIRFSHRYSYQPGFCVNAGFNVISFVGIQSR